MLLLPLLCGLATLLSNALMLACKAAISPVKVSIASVASSIAFVASEILSPNTFFLSSKESSCAVQYSILSSSSFCSFFNTSLM